MSATAVRICARCPNELRPRARRDARYCSDRCRMAASRARRTATGTPPRPPAPRRTDPVPLELRAVPRWVRHTAAKVPLTTDGCAASVTDPATWATYDEAVAAPVGAGCGLVLTDADDLVCIDLDHCLSGGRLAPWAADVLACLPRTYTEVSPSGEGLHVWVRGRLARGRRFRDGAVAIEVYSAGRYCTVTGRPYTGSSPTVAAVGDVLARLGLN